MGRLRRKLQHGLLEEVSRRVEEAADRIGDGGDMFVAYSGGMDSHVLLHLLCRTRGELPFRLAALHVDHGLHPESGDWAAHCERVCRELDVPMRCIVLHEQRAAGRSPEAWARAARYEALARHIGTDGVLATAHHRDDQAETLLLHALRGSGPRGLAAMRHLRKLGHGWLLRPMLSSGHAAIETYARDNALHWINDPANSDQRFDRNFIRHSIMPLLRSRWPGVASTLSRVAELQRTSADELDAINDAILNTAGPADPGRLAISPLMELEAGRRRLVIRRWIEKAGIPAPDRSHVEQIEQCVLNARRDAQAVVRWKGSELRRYRDELYVMRQLPPLAAGFTRVWDPRAPLRLPWGELAMAVTTGDGLAADAMEGATITVALRRGGERCRPSGRHHSQTLKHLFQEWGVPPWERGRIPLIFINGQLAAVGSICVCHPFAAQPGEAALRIDWRPAC